jgi:hypothetical protein
LKAGTQSAPNPVLLNPINAMKRLLILSGAMCAAFVATAQKSQYSGPLPRTIIKFSPQHLFVNTLHGGAELFNDDMRLSHNISLLMRYKPADPEDMDGRSSTGVAVEYMARFYPNKFKVVKKLGSEQPMGMYGGFFAQAGSYTDKAIIETYDPATFQYTEKDVRVTHTPFNIGFVLGKQMVMSDFIYIDMHLGAGLRVSNSKTDTYEIVRNGRKQYNYLNSTAFPLHGFSGILPRLGFTVGLGIQ